MLCACLRIGAARELAARTRSPALVATGLCPMGHCTGGKPLSYGASTVRDRCASGASCQLRPPNYAAGFRVAHASAPLRSPSLGWRHSTRDFPFRRAGRVVVGPRSIEGHCTGGKPLSFGARPWNDVPAAASTLRSRLSRDARARATALAVSREEAQHARFPRGHAPCRVGCGWSKLYGRALHRQ